MTLKELREQRKALDAQIAEAEKNELEAARGKVLNKIESLSDSEKEFILNSLQHSCCSCNDNNPTNGYSLYKDGWRCNKCMLMEIFDGRHGGEFDFTLDVHINRVTV